MTLTFESYHPHLPLNKDDAGYTHSDAKAAWRTWQSCKAAALQSARRSESQYVDSGKLLKAQAAKTIRASMARAL